MMGVSLCQWRYSIGMFNLKSVYKKFGKNKPILIELLFDSLGSFAGFLPIKIFLGLLKVFAFSLMIISCSSLFLVLYTFLIFFCGQASTSSYPNCSLANYFVYSLCKSILLPRYISGLIQSICSSFKNHLTEKAKNILFFVFVLLILLLISGTVEINPGPCRSKQNLSFAVWNLDSLPARDFARIPLIESLQTTYDFEYSQRRSFDQWILS